MEIYKRKLIQWERESEAVKASGVKPGLLQCGEILKFMRSQDASSKWSVWPRLDVASDIGGETVRFFYREKYVVPVEDAQVDTLPNYRKAIICRFKFTYLNVAPFNVCGLHAPAPSHGIKDCSLVCVNTIGNAANMVPKTDLFTLFAADTNVDALSPTKKNFAATDSLKDFFRSSNALSAINSNPFLFNSGTTLRRVVKYTEEHSDVIALSEKQCDVLLDLYDDVVRKYEEYLSTIDVYKHPPYKRAYEEYWKNVLDNKILDEKDYWKLLRFLENSEKHGLDRHVSWYCYFEGMIEQFGAPHLVTSSFDRLFPITASASSITNFTKFNTRVVNHAGFEDKHAGKPFRDVFNLTGPENLGVLLEGDELTEKGLKEAKKVSDHLFVIGEISFKLDKAKVTKSF